MSYMKLERFVAGPAATRVSIQACLLSAGVAPYLFTTRILNDKFNTRMSTEFQFSQADILAISAFFCFDLSEDRIEQCVQHVSSNYEFALSSVTDTPNSIKAMRQKEMEDWRRASSWNVDRVR